MDPKRLIPGELWYYSKSGSCRIFSISSMTPRSHVIPQLSRFVYDLLDLPAPPGKGSQDLALGESGLQFLAFLK